MHNSSQPFYLQAVWYLFIYLIAVDAFRAVGSEYLLFFRFVVGTLLFIYLLIMTSSKKWSLRDTLMGWVILIGYVFTYIVFRLA